MFRIFGVPARYVTGYAAPATIFTMDASGNYTALLQSDNSHAWAEIYMEGVGWVPVETTPGNIGILQYVYGEESQVEESQEEIQEEEREEQELTEEEEDTMLAEQQHYARIRLYLGGVILLLLSGVIVVLCVRRIRYELQKRGYDRSQQVNERIVSLFCMVCEALQRAGMPKEVRSTSPEFGQWLQKMLPEITPKQVETVVNMALAAAYGEKQMRDEELGYLRRIYRKCRRAVKRKKQ